MSSIAFTVLFIKTKDMLAEKENKNLKVVERFHVERKFAQGSLCVELEGLLRCVQLCIYNTELRDGRLVEPLS